MLVSQGNLIFFELKTSPNITNMAFSASLHGLTQVSIMIPLYEHVNMCTHPLLFFFSTSWVKDAVVTSLNQPLQ